MRDWEGVAAFVAVLPEEDRARFSRYAAVELPDAASAIAAVLRARAEDSGASPATLLAVTGSRAAAGGDPAFARAVGAAALEAAESLEERQLAHVCLARIHFQDRREREELEAFEEHCRTAVRLGHAGTFCYERLAALYEYRGELEEAAGICRRAVEVLEAAGDQRSARSFRKRLDRLAGKRGG